MNDAIVVTGGSSGIGKAIVEYLLENTEYHIISLSRRKRETKQKRVIQLRTDITEYKQIQRAFKALKTKNMNIVALINNAGIFEQKPFHSFSIKEMDDLIETNLRGTIYCTYETLKTMKEGNIINICSVAGKYGIRHQAVYCATKAGMRGFAEALAQELDNIYVTTVFLGGTETPLRATISENKQNLIKPEQVANIVGYILQQKRNMVTKEITVFPSNEVKKWI